MTGPPAYLSSPRHRLVPRGLLGMLVLIALGEVLIGQVEPGLVGIEPWDWRRTGRVASTAADVRDAAVLCLGDSLVKLGVQPRLLADELGQGQRAYNLALCAGRAPASYFLLRRALEAGAKPAAIVVDFNDSFLAEPPATTLRLYSELLRPRETLELAQTIRQADFAASVFTCQAFRIVQNRFEIRRAILDALLGQAQTAPKRATASAMRANWRRNLGAQVMPKVVTPLPADPAAWSWVQPSGWLPDPTNAAYLDAFFALAESQHIPVFWLLPPLHPGFTARRDQISATVPFDAFVAATRAKFPGVTVVDGRRAGYDASVFIDMAHLDRDGSARLSRSLGAVVADRLAHPGPQVVALPPFDPRHGQVAVESPPTTR